MSENTSPASEAMQELFGGLRENPTLRWAGVAYAALQLATAHTETMEDAERRSEMLLKLKEVVDKAPTEVSLTGTLMVLGGLAEAKEKGLISDEAKR